MNVQDAKHQLASFRRELLELQARLDDIPNDTDAEYLAADIELLIARIVAFEHKCKMAGIIPRGEPG